MKYDFVLSFFCQRKIQRENIQRNLSKLLKKYRAVYDFCREESVHWLDGIRNDERKRKNGYKNYLLSLSCENSFTL